MLTFVPRDILTHTAVWPQQTWTKICGGVVLLKGGGAELGPHLTQCCPGRGIPSYQMASWSIQPFGHSKHGPESGGCAT